MTLHAIAAYLRYIWAAKGRHGTHSPFVYDFVESVLQDRGHLRVDESVTYAGLPPAYNTLVNRISGRYGYDRVSQINEDRAKEVTTDRNILILPSAAETWNDLVTKYIPDAGNERVILLPDIHKTKAHTAAWERIVAMPRAPMSMDLYGVGLLVFNSDFKEKQHFTLKYKT